MVFWAIQLQASGLPGTFAAPRTKRMGPALGQACTKWRLRTDRPFWRTHCQSGEEVYGKWSSKSLKKSYQLTESIGLTEILNTASISSSTVLLRNSETTSLRTYSHKMQPGFLGSFSYRALGMRRSMGSGASSSFLVFSAGVSFTAGTVSTPSGSKRR